MSMTSLVNIAGIIVLAAYPVILCWILINQIRRRRLLSFRTLPDADLYIKEARRRYEAAIQDAETRLLASRSQLQREGVIEAQSRLLLLERTNSQLTELRHRQEKELRSLIKSRSAPYLQQLCAINNLEQFDKLRTLVDALTKRERELLEQLQTILRRESA
jgi:hypothetical protein